MDKAAKILKGYKVSVQTDGYDILDSWLEVTHAGCWFHARRKFTEVKKVVGKKKTNKESPSDNPFGSPYGSSYILRGGNWTSGTTACNSTYRFVYNPSNRVVNIGFRLAMSL